MSLATPAEGEARGEVFIVGAGFSRAVSKAMPVTSELGPLVLEEAGLLGQPHIPTEFPGSRFETWLSRLAEPQPHLSAAANAENWATFLRVAAAMASVVSAREFQAASSFPPGWFSELLTMLHYRQATIISLNYDRLVEVGVQSHRFWAEPLRTVTVSDVLGDLPPRVRPIMATPPSPLIPALSSAAGPSELPALVPTFHLLKLHGSLGWYTAGARELADLRRVDNWSRFGSPVADDEAARRRELPNTLS